MSDRITQKMLDVQVRQLNERMGRPSEPWREDGGRYIAQIGNIHLDLAYGGVQVVEMMNEGGGIRSMTDYHAPKRQAWEVLRGMHAVLDSAERGKVAEHHRRDVHPIPADWCPACITLERD